MKLLVLKASFLEEVSSHEALRDAQVSAEEETKISQKDGRGAE